MEEGELSNTSNGLIHGNDEDENFDDEKHCKTERYQQRAMRGSRKTKTTCHIQQVIKRLGNKWKKYQTNEATKN